MLNDPHTFPKSAQYGYQGTSGSSQAEICRAQKRWEDTAWLSACLWIPWDPVAPWPHGMKNSHNGISLVYHSIGLLSIWICYIIAIITYNHKPCLHLVYLWGSLSFFFFSLTGVLTGPKGHPCHASCRWKMTPPPLSADSRWARIASAIASLRGLKIASQREPNPTGSPMSLIFRLGGSSHLQ